MWLVTNSHSDSGVCICSFVSVIFREFLQKWCRFLLSARCCWRMCERMCSGIGLSKQIRLISLVTKLVEADAACALPPPQSDLCSKCSVVKGIETIVPGTRSSSMHLSIQLQRLLSSTWLTVYYQLFKANFQKSAMMKKQRRSRVTFEGCH